jgi:hypothetical protein
VNRHDPKGPTKIGNLTTGALREIRRTQAIIGTAAHGQPGDSAVACLLRGGRIGKRIGLASNCAAALYAVELALDCSRGEPLEIVSCNTYAREVAKIGNQYYELSSRIQAKLGDSIVKVIRKKEDRRFELVNSFARQVLDSDDPIWTPDPVQTKLAVQRNIEVDAESKLESPAESTIYVALRERFTEPTTIAIDPERPGWLFPAFRGDLGVLVPQFRIGRYRADFAILHGRKKVVVEVDGYTYHSSREAFANDRYREVEIVLKGWVPLRFTASDAMYDVARCVDKIVEYLELEDEI